MQHTSNWTGVTAQNDARGDDWVSLHESNSPDRSKGRKMSTQLPHSDSEEHILGRIKVTKTVLQDSTYLGEGDVERGVSRGK
jgi:hypothetical protein